jgi:hypothetical protein
MVGVGICSEVGGALHSCFGLKPVNLTRSFVPPANYVNHDQPIPSKNLREPSIGCCLQAFVYSAI